ncbi:hypothetical protein NL108_008179 [Boleophthalmus pectinirostris]|uniref:uncharacterized protein LOC110173875 isoform X1 n=1 Tax=Boleophthalmus pectinirostris TaxID=150288 RepID=UPI00242F759F|nr:uncharacterized protein LOC110173875 isoform X1 [Boleophthalmus pectinirostris]XP_055013728.1 uncharacterized protein LOC110173875 isoform X1 [Boleophthalmus pectinirostris]KAJ0050836.1 hypothetical protein NL108_008179 [Boleophthalmus pectinirostris]
MTPIQQSLKETNSETSLNALSSTIKNVAENRQENVASSCNKTTSRLNSLFASLTPDMDPTSTVKNSVSGTTTVQSSQRFESDCGNQKVSSSKTKQKGIESDTSPPAKKFHALFASLTPDSDRTPTVSNGTSEKPAVRIAPKCGKSVSASKKSTCGSNKETQPGRFTDNTPISTNSKTDYHSKMLASTSVTANFKCSTKEEDMESTKSLPAKPFQSLFASLTPDSDRTSTVINSVGHKPAVSSAQKVKNSICDCQKVNCDSNQALKPSQCTGNTSESPNNSSSSNHMQVEASTETPSNNSEGLVTSSARSEFKVTNKKNEKKFHQSLFASLTSDSDQTTAGNNFSKKTTVPNAQKVYQSICTSEKINCGSNQATKQSQCPGNMLESMHNSSNHSERLISATTNLKSLKKEDTETAKTASAKLFQSLFASLTPTVTKSVGDKLDICAHNVEKSKCQKDNSDSNQAKSAKQSQFTENSSESTYNDSCSTYDEVGLVTESTKTKGQKLISSSATSNLQSKNKKDYPDSTKTPHAKSFQNLLEVDPTSTVQSQKVEKSIFDSPKVKCDASQATKQSQYSESTPKSSSSSSHAVAARTETLNNNCQKPVSSPAMSKGENQETESAKSFNNIFAAPLGESSATNDSKMPCLPNRAQCMGGKLSHNKHSLASYTENKRIEESKNEPRKKSATNSSNVLNTASARPQQTNNGPPSSILRTLFQQLRPYEQQEHQVCIKGSIRPG